MITRTVEYNEAEDVFEVFGPEEDEDLPNGIGVVYEEKDALELAAAPEMRRLLADALDLPSLDQESALRWLRDVKAVLEFLDSAEEEEEEEAEAVEG